MLKGIGYTEKNDIWCLGVLLYELLHGRAPFHPEEKMKNEQAIMSKLESNILRGQLQISGKLSPEAREIVALLLHPNPADRPTAMEIFHFEFFKNYGITFESLNEENFNQRRPNDRLKTRY